MAAAVAAEVLLCPTATNALDIGLMFEGYFWAHAG